MAGQVFQCYIERLVGLHDQNLSIHSLFNKALVSLRGWYVYDIGECQYPQEICTVISS
jgi:hypothetical protein